jgi:hypothetical protein
MNNNEQTKTVVKILMMQLMGYEETDGEMPSNKEE